MASGRETCRQLLGCIRREASFLSRPTVQHATRIGDPSWSIGACGTLVALLLALLAAALPAHDVVLAPTSGSDPSSTAAATVQAPASSGDHGPDTDEALLHGWHGLPLDAIAEPRPYGGSSVLEIKGRSLSITLPAGQLESPSPIFTRRLSSSGARSRPLRHWLGIYLL